MRRWSNNVNFISGMESMSWGMYLEKKKTPRVCYDWNEIWINFQLVIYIQKTEISKEEWKLKTKLLAREVVDCPWFQQHRSRKMNNKTRKKLRFDVETIEKQYRTIMGKCSVFSQHISQSSNIYAEQIETNKNKHSTTEAGKKLKKFFFFFTIH